MKPFPRLPVPGDSVPASKSAHPRATSAQRISPMRAPLLPPAHRRIPHGDSVCAAARSVAYPRTVHASISGRSTFEAGSRNLLRAARPSPRIGTCSSTAMTSGDAYLLQERTLALHHARAELWICSTPISSSRSGPNAASDSLERAALRDLLRALVALAITHSCQNRRSTTPNRRTQSFCDSVRSRCSVRSM